MVTGCEQSCKGSIVVHVLVYGHQYGTAQYSTAQHSMALRSSRFNKKIEALVSGRFWRWETFRTAMHGPLTRQTAFHGEHTVFLLAENV